MVRFAGTQRGLHSNGELVFCWIAKMEKFCRQIVGVVVYLCSRFNANKLYTQNLLKWGHAVRCSGLSLCEASIPYGCQFQY